MSTFMCKWEAYSRNRERWPARPYSSSGAGSGVVLRQRAAAAAYACMDYILINISMSKLFSGNFNSLIFELTPLILAHVVRQGTALSSRGTCPDWPRPRAATELTTRITAWHSVVCYKDVHVKEDPGLSISEDRSRSRRSRKCRTR